MAYFKFMGFYWSCTQATLDAIEQAVYEGKGVDLHAMGCRLLKSRPKSFHIRMNIGL